MKVYPTENYYYFGFFHNGIRYAGNIRLDASNRDDGKVDVRVFRGYLAVVRGRRGQVPRARCIARRDASRRSSRCVYRVTYQGKSVIFALNDLRGVKPPPARSGRTRSISGRSSMNSRSSSICVFNTKLKVFHYVLDESGTVPDQFFSPKKRERILVGKRTGFAFYQDHRLNRKILIGAFEGNMRANNYFDGPFDQLPDNFIEGEALRDAILAVRPQLKGEIDRFGASPDGSIRFISGRICRTGRCSDLDPIDACAAKKQKQPDYYRCFVTDDESGGMVAPKRGKSGQRQSSNTMDWDDEGIVLGVRRHGEANAIVEVMTRAHGRHLGLVRGGAGSRMRPVLQPGNTVRVTWRARLDEHLGHYTVEGLRLRAARADDRGACGLRRDASRGAVPAAARARSARGGARHARRDPRSSGGSRGRGGADRALRVADAGRTRLRARSRGSAPRPARPRT